MHVVHVLHSMAIAGAEVLVHDFVLRAPAGLEQSVVTLDQVGALGQALRERGIAVECLDRRPGLDTRLPLRLAQALARLRADVVHAHQYTPYFYSALATRLLSRRPALIFTEHGRHVPDVRRPKRVAFNRIALSWTARVTAVCGYVKRSLVTNEGIDPERIQVIYNGVNPSKFADKIDGGPVRRGLGIDEDERVVTCVARFHPVKDHSTLLRGFAYTSARVPHTRLLLAGEGSGEPGLRALASALGIAPKVVFAGARRDIPELLAASDLFAMTSLSEGTSVTLLEAMLARRATVVTNVGGNPEIVEHGTTGLLVPREKPEAVGDALSALLCDPARCRAFGRAGRARALGTFSQEKMQRAWTELYASAMVDRGVVAE